MSALIATMTGIVMSLAFTALSILSPANAAGITVLLLISAIGLYGYARHHHPHKRRRP